jgi:hypothetical protein
MRELSHDPNFLECIAITDRAMEERYDMELVLRFLVFRRIDENLLRNTRDLGDFLTDSMVEMARPGQLDMTQEEVAFRQTFEIIGRDAKADAFRKFDHAKGRFVGGFLISAFEVVAIGIGHRFEQFASATPPMDIREKVKTLWNAPEFVDGAISSGVRASSRIPKTIALGRRLFQP